MVRSLGIPPAFTGLLAGLSDPAERQARAQAIAEEIQSARASLGPAEPTTDEPDPTGELPPDAAVAPEPENLADLRLVDAAGPEGASPPELPPSQPGEKVVERIQGTESLRELEELQREGRAFQ